MRFRHEAVIARHAVWTGVALGLVLAFGCTPREAPSVSSPDGRLCMVLGLDDRGTIRYSVEHDSTNIVWDSCLGAVLNDTSFTEGLEMSSVSPLQSISQSYAMATGKQRDITYSANERTISFVNSEGEAMDVVVRVSDDGVAFRYGFPGTAEGPRTVLEELTTFRLAPGGTAWLQPMQVAKTGWKRTNPAYEEHYQMAIPVGTPSPSEAGWVFPALFETEGRWILITEAGMDGRYCGSRLQPQSDGGEYRLGFPMADEVVTGGGLLPESDGPFHSPWRIIAVGSLATIVESTLGTDLAAPAIDLDPSFVQPGQASWSWALLKDESITFDVQSRFVDHAADMGWEYTLVDVDWDSRIGMEKTEELVEYAAARGVGILLWYNSSGDWNDTEYHPKSALLTHADRVEEFSRLRDMGVRGVKVDFFPGDGRSSIQYAREILQDAADYGLLVNFHGATIPRGLQRTYPNLMTVEAVRGFEFITFFQESADLEARHAAVLPFTRNIFDPMDFTPMVLDEIPGRVRKTSNGFQLALPVLFLSGIQHLAETPDGMAGVPEQVKELLRALPDQWDESRVVDGYPGRFVVIGRRSGQTWWIAGINGEDGMTTIHLDLSFLGEAVGTIVSDGAEEFSFRTETVRASNDLGVDLRPRGGFVLVIDQGVDASDPEGDG